jgi:glycosyltransferase involved in cell wall biosynthesis
MKIVVVQPLLPHYSIAFFNRVVELHPDVSLLVLADIETRNALNQYDASACRFRVAHLPNVERFGFAYRPGLISQLGAERPDVVVFSGAPRDLSQLAALILYRSLGRNAVAWGMFHRIGGPRMLSNAYFRLVGSVASKCLTYTRVGASHLISLGVSKNRIGVIGTAIDERGPISQKQARTPADVAQFRRAEGLEDKAVVLQVVRLSRIKRPELLVLAAETALKGRANLVFVLIGDGEMRAELEHMVAQRGMSEAFRFLGAIYDETVLSYWYLSAAAFVVPTCIGLSAHHAMCYGVPLVTDDSLDSQASEFSILADGLNCITYREGSALDLAQVILELVDNSELSGKLRSNCELTISRHTLSAKTNHFVSELKAVVRPPTNVA